MTNFYSKKDYQNIADLFGLGKIQELTHLHKGFQTPKAAVTTNLGKFVISRPRLSNRKLIISKSKKSLQYEIDLLEMLRGLPVPSYHKSPRGRHIEKYKGSFVTVDKFLPGKSPKGITASMARELGEFLGEFHQQGIRFKKTLKERRKFYDLNPGVMKRMEKYAFKQSNPLLKSVVQEIKQGVEKNRPPAALPRGPIHVDIKPENELFLDNKLSAVVDFGNFYVGPLMIDVGKTIMWNCCDHGKLNETLFKAFLSGYKSKRTMTKKEVSYLKKSILFAIYSHIWVDLYHVPLKYVPESYTLFLVKNFLPVAREIKKSGRA